MLRPWKTNGVLIDSQDLMPPVLIALLNVAAMLSLYIFRSFDDNRLASWSWVFADFSPLKLFAMLAAGMLVAYAISRISLPARTSIYLLAIASFLLGSFFWRQPEIILDASRYIVQAKYIELHGPGYFLKEWGQTVPAWTDMPLVPFVYGIVFHVFGETKLGIQVVTSLLFSGTVVLTYLIGRTLWNENIGLSAGALLLGIPYLFTQVPLFMVDIATMFFLTLAVFAIIKAVDTGYMAHCILASAAITLALLTKYSNWLVFGVMPFIFLGYFRRGWKALAREGAIIAAAVFIFMGIFLGMYSDVISEQLRLLRTYQVPALGGWSESYVSTFFFQVHPIISLAAIFAACRALAKRDIKFLIVCSLVLIVLLLGVKRIRYLMVIFPMLTLTSAYGLESLKNAKIKRFVVSCTAISAILIAAFAYLPFLERTSAVNIKQAGEFLDSIAVNNVRVYVQPQSGSSINPAVTVPILDLYTKRKLFYQEAGDPPDVVGSIDKLPLRWTWELSSPQYLTANPGTGDQPGAIVIIQGTVNQPLPAHISEKLVYYHLSKEFNVSDGIFKFQTIVRIFQPNRKDAGEEPS